MATGLPQTGLLAGLLLRGNGAPLNAVTGAAAQTFNLNAPRIGRDEILAAAALRLPQRPFKGKSSAKGRGKQR